MKTIPYFAQETAYTCGPASLRMVLASFGVQKTERQLEKLLKTTRRAGTRAAAFPAVADHFHLTYAVHRDATLTDVVSYLERGYRIIVGYRTSFRGDGDGHYAVVQKIDSNSIYLLDPYPDSPRDSQKYKLFSFQRLWRKGLLYDKERAWFIAMNLSSRQLR